MLIAQANISGTCDRRACIIPSAFSIVNSCGGTSLFLPLRNSTTGHLIGLSHKRSDIRTSPVLGFSSLSFGDKATSMSCFCFASRHVRKSVTFPTEPLTSTPCSTFCPSVRAWRYIEAVLPHLDQHNLRADLEFDDVGEFGKTFRRAGFHTFNVMVSGASTHLSNCVLAC